MKKILVAILLVVSLLTGILAMSSCGGGKKNQTQFVMPENGYDGSAVTISFYHTMGENLSTVLDAYIVEFNKLFPNITIAHEQVGGYDDVRNQISTELTVGNQPNIAYCYPDHVAVYNIAGAVVTLDQFIESTIEVTDADGNKTTLGLTQEQIDDFIDGYYAEGREFGDGKMYTLPLSKSTEVLYYNKTFFEENNISVPTTWAELEAVCAQIKAIDEDCTPLGYDSEANWFITMCEQYGSDYTSAGEDHFLFDNETNRNFVEMFREWYQKGYVTTQEILEAYTSTIFVEEKSYMSIGSSAGATHQRPKKGDDGKYPFEVGVAPIPQVDASKPKAISQGPSLCIFNSDNPQEVVASWLFMKYLTTTVEFQAEFSIASGYIPVIESVKENATYAAFLEKADGGDYIAASTCKLGIDQKDAYYTSPAFNGSSVARDQVGALMQKCFVTKTEDVKGMIKKAFEEAVAECEYQAG